MKLLFCLIVLLAAPLLACSGAAPTPTPTPGSPLTDAVVPDAPTPTSALIWPRSQTPAPTPTDALIRPGALAPVPTFGPAPTNGLVRPGGPNPGLDKPILPLDMSSLGGFLSELSATERTCMPEGLPPAWLAGMDDTLWGQAVVAEALECLADETLLRMFVSGLTSDTGPLSAETSACVRGGVGEPLRLMLLPEAGVSRAEAAMVGNTTVLMWALSCLNDEEWLAASAALGLSPEGRESLRCVLAELGGPVALAEVLQPAAGEPPETFIRVALLCGLQGFGP